MVVGLFLTFIAIRADVLLVNALYAAAEVLAAGYLGGRGAQHFFGEEGIVLAAENQRGRDDSVERAGQVVLEDCRNGC